MDCAVVRKEYLIHEAIGYCASYSNLNSQQVQTAVGFRTYFSPEVDASSTHTTNFRRGYCRCPGGLEGPARAAETTHFSPQTMLSAS